MKTKSASFQVEFEVPERASDEQIVKWTAVYRVSRCPNLKEKLIEGHMRLALNLAGRFMSSDLRRKDDLCQAALLGLTQAVVWAPDRLHNDNITPYIVATVISFIRKHLNKDNLIPIEKNAFRKMAEASNGVDFLPYFNTLNKADIDEDDGVPFVDYTPAVEDDKDFIFMSEYFEFLHKGDERYKTILKMLLEDYNQVEIAKELGLSKQYINQCVQVLRERIEYWRKNYEKDN